MNTTRRQFFKLTAGAAALTAMPDLTLASDVPVIWADGVHDDGPGLSALLRGEVVEFASAKAAKAIEMVGDKVLFGDRAKFRLSSPIVIPPGRHVTLQGGSFLCNDGVSLLVDGGTVRIDGMTYLAEVDGRPTPPLIRIKQKIDVSKVRSYAAALTPRPV